MVLTFVKRLYLGSAFTRNNFGVPAEDSAEWMWRRLLWLYGCSLSPALSLCTDRTPPNEAAVAQRRSLNARDRTNVTVFSVTVLDGPTTETLTRLNESVLSF